MAVLKLLTEVVGSVQKGAVLWVRMDSVGSLMFWSRSISVPRPGSSSLTSRYFFETSWEQHPCVLCTGRSVHIREKLCRSVF